jgi:hypothetical protein
MFVLLMIPLAVGSLLLFPAVRAIPRILKFAHVWHGLSTAPFPIAFGYKLKIAWEAATSDLLFATNSIQPEFMGNKVRSFTGNSSITARWMLVKYGGSVGTVAACAAVTDIPIGVCMDMYNSGASTSKLTVIPLCGAYGLIPLAVTSGGSFAEGDMVYSDGAGLAAVAPTTSSSQGTYVRVGQCLSGETTAANYIALAPCVPVVVGVITATGASSVANVVTLLKLATTPQEVLFA